MGKFALQASARNMANLSEKYVHGLANYNTVYNKDSTYMQAKGKNFGFKK